MMHDVWLRQWTIRPLGPGDASALAAAFDRLSPQSRYQRFLGQKQQLSPAELEWFTNIDHVGHEAIAAFDAGELIGVARYFRDHNDPTVAEVAVTVVDRYQGRGLGTALLQRLVKRAVDEGITQFRAELLAANRRVLALLRRTCSIRQVRHAGMGVLEAVADLPLESTPCGHLEDVV
jgi:RimJ/RimL family protein N-acetyltransferase